MKLVLPSALATCFAVVTPLIGVTLQPLLPPPTGLPPAPAEPPDPLEPPLPGAAPPPELELEQPPAPKTNATKAVVPRTPNWRS